MLLGLIALVTVAGSLYLVSSKPKVEQIEIWVPRHTIPAYSRLVESDVTTRTVRASSLSADSFREKASLVGRVALERLGQDEPVRKNQLGAFVMDDSLRSKVILSVQLTYSQALGGQLRSGDLVTLTGAGFRGNPTEVPDLLVLDNRQQTGSSNYSLTIAVNRRAVSHISLLDKSQMIVVRVVPYSY